MTLCSGRGQHEEIVYEGHQCPLCEALSEMERLRSRVDSLEEELQERGS